MADFCDGFVFERDVPEPPMLTIEGRPIEGFKEIKGFDGRRRRFAALLPSGKRITASSVKVLVRRYLRRTNAFEKRQVARITTLNQLRKRQEVWNQWRHDHPDFQPMLACVKSGVDFTRKRLDGYDFSYANLCEAQLQGLSFKGANFHQAILAGANLSDANLEGANFCRTDLYKTIFTNASLKGANLQGVQLAYTDLTRADVRDCTVYGMSTWDLKLEGAKQNGLIIRYQPTTARNKEDVLRVDGLDAAAFMYFALHNRNISTIMNAAGEKWVLILGRFTKGKVLERVRDALKDEQFIPVIFDFERPKARDLTETVMLLAGMSAFVIVDISNPRSTPLELQAIVSNYGVPVIPIKEKGTKTFSMFSGLSKFQWVSRPVEYENANDLIARLRDSVIKPALERGRQLAAAKWGAEAL